MLACLVVLADDGQDERPVTSAGGWLQAVTRHQSEALRYYFASVLANGTISPTERVWRKFASGGSSS